MSAAASSGTQVATIKPCGSSSSKNFRSSKATFATKHEKSSAKRLATCFSTAKQLHGSFISGPAKSVKAVIRARSAADEDKPLSGLPVDLRGERAFTAGVADDNGYGWAIAKSLAAAGAEILVGTGRLNVLNIFESSLRRGKFDESDCQMEIADSVKQDFGSIYILVYSLAYGPKDFPLLNIFMLRYGAGMSLANSALENDTRIKKVGNATAFRASPLASAITGAVIFVGNGLNAMGVGADSPTFEYLDIPKAK